MARKRATVERTAGRSKARATATTRHGSFRISAAVLDRLDARAAELNTSRSQLIERYVDEGMRRDRHPLIHFRDGAAGRRAALAGTRIDVWQVIETVRAEGGSVSAAAAYFDQPAAKIAAAVSYYADFTEEVDAFAERSNAAADAAEEASRRERAVLTR